MYTITSPLLLRMSGSREEPIEMTLTMSFVIITNFLFYDTGLIILLDYPYSIFQENGIVCTQNYLILKLNSTGPAAEPSGRFPPPLSAGGGMGTPPVYWQAGGGDLYI